MRHLDIWHKAAAAVVLIGLGGAAQAALVGTFPGNDCQNDGTLFSGTGANCVLLSTASDLIPQDTPLIAKFDYVGGDIFSLAEIGTDYIGLIEGGEFRLTADAGGNTGTWLYQPDAGDPFLSAYLTKAGNEFSLFTVDSLNPDGGAGGNWQVITSDGVDRELSHISFFNNGSVPQAPVPAPLALIGAGVLGLTMVRRRRAKA